MASSKNPLFNDRFLIQSFGKQKGVTDDDALGFFDVENRYAALSRAGDPLAGLQTTISRESFHKPLKQALRRKNNGLGGRPSFDEMLVFKILALQVLYNLSDDRTEYQIRDRLSFMWFLELAGMVPDAKTIWLFREHLAQAGAVVDLFARFDRHLEEKSLMARGGQIIDASFIPIPRQRNTHAENAAIKVGETPEEWQEEPAKLWQIDISVRWTVENGQHHYGYKNHVSADNKHKPIRRYHVTDACVHDTTAFDEVFDAKNAAKDIWTDGAYRVQAREAALKARARVEHVLGCQFAMGDKLMRCIGGVRAAANIGIKTSSTTRNDSSFSRNWRPRSAGNQEKTNTHT